MKKQKKAPLNQFQVSTRNETFLEEGKIISFLPLETVNELNRTTVRTGKRKGKFEHWAERDKRHKTQKQFIRWSLASYKHHIKLPCTVIMTRFAPRFLDEEDNLRVAFKWIKDAIAEIVTGDLIPGRADSDKRIKWEYGQEKCNEYSVKIEIIF